RSTSTPSTRKPPTCRWCAKAAPPACAPCCPTASDSAAPTPAWCCAAGTAERASTRATYGRPRRSGFSRDQETRIPGPLARDRPPPRHARPPLVGAASAATTVPRPPRPGRHAARRPGRARQAQAPGRNGSRLKPLLRGIGRGGDVDAQALCLHHLARADLAGLAQLHGAIDAHGAAGHERLAGASAVDHAAQLQQLVEFDVVALEFERRFGHGALLSPAVRAASPKAARPAPGGW